MSINVYEMLNCAKEKNYAIGAFNIFNYLSAKAVVNSANDLGVGAIIQTSVGTVLQFGVEELSGMLKEIINQSAMPIAVHLDHCTNLDLSMQCLDSGWDSVMFDGSALPLGENIEQTLRIANYAHKLGKQVEGELGRIAGVEEEISVANGVDVRLEEAMEFMKNSSVDFFAPAIGTAHGVYKASPKINFELLETICKSATIPVVIHGGTGLSSEVFKRMINLGASKINVSTALKVAYKQGLQEAFAKNESNPLKIDAQALETLTKAVKQHMQIFAN